MTKQELTVTIQAQAEKIIKLKAEKNYYKKLWELVRELNTQKTQLVAEFIDNMNQLEEEAIKKARE